MARTFKPARNAAPRRAASGGHGVESADPASDEATAFSVDLTRSLVNASLGASQGLLRFLDQVHQTNAQTLKELSTSLAEAMVEAGGARDSQELLTLQANLVSSQMARAAQNYAALLTRWLDAETQFVEQAQEEAAKLSHRMLGNGAGAAPQGSASLNVDPTPLAMIASAQNALTEMTGQWVAAVRNAAAQTELPRH
jgi:hypothetical protein